MDAEDGSAAHGDEDGITMHGDPASPHWFVSAASSPAVAVAIESARRRVRAGLEGAADAADPTGADPMGAGDELARRRRTDVAPAREPSCVLEIPASTRRVVCPPATLRRLDRLVRAHRPGTLAVFRHASLLALPSYLEHVLEMPAEPGEPLGALTLGTWDATAVALGCAPSFPFSPSNAFYRAMGERLRARAATTRADGGVPGRLPGRPLG